MIIRCLRERIKLLEKFWISKIKFRIKTSRMTSEDVGYLVFIDAKEPDK